MRATRRAVALGVVLALDWKTVDVATMIRTSAQDTPAYRAVAGTAVTTTPTSPTVRDYG